MVRARDEWIERRPEWWLSHMDSLQESPPTGNDVFTMLLSIMHCSRLFL